MWFFYILGILSSLFYSIYCLGDTGDIPVIKPSLYPIMYKGMLIIPMNTRIALHIHHWMVYVIILFCSRFQSIPSIIIGFSGGMIVQGLSYSDCFYVICENPWKLKT